MPCLSRRFNRPAQLVTFEKLRHVIKVARHTIPLHFYTFHRLISTVQPTFNWEKLWACRARQKGSLDSGKPTTQPSMASHRPRVLTSSICPLPFRKKFPSCQHLGIWMIGDVKDDMMMIVVVFLTSYTGRKGRLLGFFAACINSQRIMNDGWGGSARDACHFEASLCNLITCTPVNAHLNTHTLETPFSNRIELLARRRRLSTGGHVFIRVQKT